MLHKKPIIGIAGRHKSTKNYEMALSRLQIPYKTSLSLGEIRSLDGLLLPGGGDITPAFFGQKNAGSINIDTELDIIQLQALEYMTEHQKPVLGICKGMQLINVFFGGTIIQHMKQASSHAYQDGDQYHESLIIKNSFLYNLYGEHLIINSAHHQCVDKLGQQLKLLQFSFPNQVPEALSHESDSIIGVQWHPERLPENGDILLDYFYSLINNNCI